MKKLLTFVLISFFAATTFAQSVDLRRKITVTGNAETEVTPDIIYFSISLKEYLNGKSKISISTLENQLEKAVSAAGIAKADFTINNLSSYNYVPEKKKNADFLASKQYRLKLHDLSKINKILDAVDDKGIQSTGIDGYDYSGIEALKSELKLKALKAAQTKAAFLLSGIGEKLGNAIDIQEINNEPMQQPVFRSMMMKTASSDAVESDIDFKKIKLNYHIQAVFEILK
ncbi:SIMPL domain-containing protein [Mucilaginibacter sp.]|uniref:SIMPL domain-containing protein n=1 Tax=Mucilaginibacter sp. TaxID=1882438 RepID=UPI003B008921